MPRDDLVQKFAEAREPAIRQGFLNPDGSLGPRWYAAENPLRANPIVRKIMEPAHGRPEVIVSVGTPQGRLDELRRAGYEPVTDERFSRMLGELPDVPRIEQDPDTGRREYLGSVSSLTPRSFTSAPPQVIEPSRVFGMAPIDRFALRPGAAFAQAMLPGAQFDGEEPTFFSSGDLPPLTASGADPQILKWCAWEARHSAAFCDSKSQLLEIVEASAEGLTDYDDLQNEAGRFALNSYIGRVRTWANTIPIIDQAAEPTEHELASWYPPGTEH